MLVEGFVYGGGPLVVDTASHLNKTGSSRIEFLDEPEDVAALQEAGLIPSELRYQWRELASIDFSKFALAAYFGPSQGTTGHFAEFAGPWFAWDNGTIRGDIRNYALSAGTVDSPVSPLVIQTLSYLDQPVGTGVSAFEGVRTFEFSVDGLPTITRVVENRPIAPTPIPVHFRGRTSSLSE
jgi:hypothetical protein